MNQFKPKRPTGPSNPTRAFNTMDLGPGALGGAPAIPMTALSDLIANGFNDGRPDLAMQAQGLITQRVQSVNYNMYTQTVNIPAPLPIGVHTYLQQVQILNSNLNRKTLSIQCFGINRTVGTEFGNIGTTDDVFFGVIFQNGPLQVQTLEDAATNQLLARTLMLGEVGFFPEASAFPFYEFNPAPTNAITIVVYYGPGYSETGIFNQIVVIEGT